MRNKQIPKNEQQSAIDKTRSNKTLQNDLVEMFEILKKRKQNLPNNERTYVLDRIKAGTAQISIDERTVHIKLKPFALDTWNHETDGDVMLVLGRRYWFKHCKYCNSRLYKVVKLHRQVVLGLNEQVYEHIDVLDNNYGSYCSTCGYSFVSPIDLLE